MSFRNVSQAICVAMATFIHKLNQTRSFFSFAITSMCPACHHLLHSFSRQQTHISSIPHKRAKVSERIMYVSFSGSDCNLH